MTAYRAVYERDATGWWVATVPEVPACHAQARTLRGARRRTLEALSLWDEGADAAELADEIRLPAEAQRALESVRRARVRAERERISARSATRETARLLTGRYGLSLRDTADLLELSHQRVQQLADAAKD